ncbi:hypothetical protein EVG20_g269 [Dentipellis fragilis]|uniref:Uncharacterized protein n=1 Tax=Dentipellis fragilis TaxID=205917 RepID=A0A4Y9ZH07_9AGAM|nr:hypothetical protein EVG20_g269 [Dentipellis fragilis]
MCYAYGSIDQATGVCPMCKVFKPSTARSLLSLTQRLPPPSDLILSPDVPINKMCATIELSILATTLSLSRMPKSRHSTAADTASTGENRLIPPADWPAVTAVHHISIPSEVKALLESLNIAVPSRAPPSIGHPTGGGKATSPPLQAPALDRRSSSGAVPTRAAATSARTQPLTIPGPGKTRSGGSPKEVANSLLSTTPRGPGVKGSPPPANTSPVDQGHSRRQSNLEHGDKLVDSPNTPSPLRRNIELDGPNPHRSSDRRPSVSTVKVTTTSAKAGADSTPQLRRRASVTDATPSGNSASLPQVSSRTLERNNTVAAVRTRSTKRSSLDIDFAAMSVSGSSNSSGSGDSHSDAQSYVGSDGTVTSDGGFTDYLSDESEAELQRQAELKAALLAQNQMEEQEFKAARQQLANVDLRPPKSWNPGATPRSQAPATSNYPGSIAGGAYSTPTRGQVDAVGFGRAR